ncbi:hypothetical protein NW759_010194 [Fusarium solani]|nr:hypothetical protein NW759_010194 [Fusarium solani]
MDERVRREEDSQAKQTRQVNETGKVERRPTPPRSSKTDRRSRWPFSWKDFAKTDEFRLPTISPELAAFFRSPVRALPGRQITDPSSLPRISERNDNGQSQSEPSQSTAQSSMEPHEVGVGQLTNPTGTRTREEREASYAMPSTSKPHGKQREVSLQPQTPPKATTPASLERMREDESARRHQSLPITPQPKANTQGSEEEAQSISVENTVATGGKIAGGAPETEDMHLECTCLTIGGPTYRSKSSKCSAAKEISHIEKPTIPSGENR